MTQIEADSPLLLVGIGLSAGGQRSLEHLLRAMPAGTGCCLVVVGDRSPEFDTVLEEALARPSVLPVRLAEHGARPQADTLYLAAPRSLLAIKDGRFAVEGLSNGTLPINTFFSSLAAYGSKSAALLLSGAGIDGAEGARRVGEAGGLVLLQDPADAEYSSVLGAARALVPWAITVPVSQMPGRLVQAVKTHGEADPGWDDPLLAALELLRERVGADFRQYRPERLRLRLKQFDDGEGGCRRSEFVSSRPRDRSGLDALYHALLGEERGGLIEDHVLESLRENVFLPLLERGPSQEIRVWVAGCGGGEEAYSLAMLFDDITAAAATPPRLRLFATDPHPASIERAVAGIALARRLQNLGAWQGERYFTARGEGEFLVHPELRKRVLFARHQLLDAPPFPRLDLVCCRQLLGDLQPEARQVAIGRLTSGLREGGGLLLGAGEELGEQERFFRCVDKQSGLYLKRAASTSTSSSSALPTGRFSDRTGAGIRLWSRPPRPTLTIDPRLLDAYDRFCEESLGDGFLIDEAFHILQFLGNASSYLLPERGRANPGLLERCEEGLKLSVSVLVTRAVKHGVRAVARGLTVPFEGQSRQVDVSAEPLVVRSSSCLVWLRFEPASSAPAAERSSSPPTSSSSEELNPGGLQQRLVEVEYELVNTRDHLRMAVEELQLRNEELKLVNEALLDTNDELQASIEGLSSLNDELTAMNGEFERKNRELSVLGDDLQNLLDSTQVGTLFLDRKLCIRRFNPSIEQIFHLRAQDIGRPLRDISYHLADAGSLEEKLQSVLESGIVLQHEVRLQSRGRWLLQRLLPFRDRRGEIQGVVLTFTDISVSKTLESRLALAHRAAGIAWWEWTPLDDRVLWHGDVYALLGYLDEELPISRQEWASLVHPEDRDEIRKVLSTAPSGSLPSLEVRCRRSDGSWAWLQICGQRARNSEHLWVGTVLDVTLRRQAQHESRRHATILSNIGAAVICLDRRGAVSYWNQEVASLLGWSAEETLGAVPWERFSDQRAQQMRTYFLRGMAGETVRGEFREKTAAGLTLWVDFTLAPKRGTGGESLGVVVVLHDITEDRRIRELLRRDAQILESLRDSVIEVDTENIITLWSRGAEEMLGWSQAEALGRKLEFRYPALLRSRMEAFFQGLVEDPSSTPTELQDLCRDGSARWVLWRGRKLDTGAGGAVFFGTDVDEQRRLLGERQAMQQQLFQSQKMEVLGTLAGGIAHDFNNLLATMLGNTEHALHAASPEAREEALGDVLSAGQRARDLVQRLLRFARQEEPSRVAVDLVALVHEVYKLLRSSFPSSLEMQLSCPRRPLWIMGDATQMHQVVMNFCSNAADAMEHKGELGLLLGEDELDEEDAFLTGQVPAGRYAMIRVSDTGPGIPPHQVPRLFDPFFTTKAPGKGTGLGLSIVHGIVKAHGGAVDIQTAVGRGTTFTVYLPLGESSPEESEEREPVRISSSETERGSQETILVLDDEESVARMTVRQLTSLGYQASYMIDPLQARERLLEAGETPHLLITDVNMPVLTGVDLTLALRAGGSELPVLLTSGYVPDDLPEQLGRFDVLTKPFRRDDLARAVKGMLSFGG